MNFTNSRYDFSRMPDEKMSEVYSVINSGFPNIGNDLSFYADFSETNVFTRSLTENDMTRIIGVAIVTRHRHEREQYDYLPYFVIDTAFRRENWSMLKKRYRPHHGRALFHHMLGTLSAPILGADSQKYLKIEPTGDRATKFYTKESLGVARSFEESASTVLTVDYGEYRQALQEYRIDQVI